ncbi:AcrR family transcriptional regulator [Bacillus pakistanensis]|uniref:AcrR family transcriptional regulator n=1 Tax=Rossellomorea pakistanensis TaxID=992288 RepID=A0ABS2NJ97_9BACI|nr:TetR/AcrR family transcriptional regulator [Bacillus pakistanensis]MBM7587875.1 AcrR family transcriptional regulator [Bacillus pakistanensis]
MKEKERLIIETAMKLFATKGFTATSIQEIATESGISKGAFYLHFKSKEALLLAILKYYFNRMHTMINKIENENLDPRTQFMKQMQCQLIEIQKHKEFIIMQARENAIPFNDEIEQLIHSMRLESNLFYTKSIMSIYGKKVKPYLYDVSLMLQGFFHSFLELIMLDKIKVDIPYLTEYMLKRADDIVEGLLKSNDPSVVPTEKMEQFISDSISKNLNKESILKSIQRYKEQFSQKKEEDVYITLEVLEEEIARDHSRIPVIQGMLANLKDHKPLKEFRRLVAQYFGISL